MRLQLGSRSFRVQFVHSQVHGVEGHAHLVKNVAEKLVLRLQRSAQL